MKGSLRAPFLCFRRARIRASAHAKHILYNKVGKVLFHFLTKKSEKKFGGSVLLTYFCSVLL